MGDNVNATSQALRGYADNSGSTRSDRRREYDVIARVTQELRDGAVQRKTNFGLFAEALHRNQRLWTALVVDIADVANPLPKELKARIVYLAEFTSQHTGKVLRENASVMPLLEINMAVLRGLKHEGTAA